MAKCLNWRQYYSEGLLVPAVRRRVGLHSRDTVQTDSELYARMGRCRAGGDLEVLPIGNRPGLRPAARAASCISARSGETDCSRSSEKREAPRRDRWKDRIHPGGND